MLHPLHSRYVPDPSKQAIDLSWSFLRILPTCTMNARWTWLFHGDFPTFPSNPCMAVSCPPVLQRLELRLEAYVETPHRMTFCYTTSLSTTVQYIYIHQYITILQYYMSLLYQIISLMWMPLWRLFVDAHVYTFLHVFTASYLMNNLLGIACLVS